MKDCLVIGRPNCGKTLFLINFAEYLGYKEIGFNVERADGSRWHRRYTLMEARMILVGPTAHLTQSLYSAEITLGKGKRKVELRLTDSTGLCEGIHEQIEVRQAMVHTLKRLRQVELILHLIDATDVTINGVSKLDEQLARYATGRSRYAILANKMDLSQAEAGFVQLKNRFPHHMVIPVSALKRTGFSEVKTFVVGAY